MSFKDQRRKKVQDASFTRDEFSLLRDALEAKLEKNPDHAVEDLFDYITKNESLFRFKKPLGKDFNYAKNNAETSLWNTALKPVPPKLGVSPFVQYSLKCLEAVCLVYLRDILKSELSKTINKNVKEKEIFESFKFLDDAELKDTGIKLCHVYQIRNKLIHGINRDSNNSLRLRQLSTDEILEYFRTSISMLSSACKVLLSKYKDHFPECKIGLITE